MISYNIDYVYITRERIDMALVKCPDCGKSMSEKASICPKCGCPNDGNFRLVEKGKNKRGLLIGLFGVVVVLLLVYIYTVIAQPSEDDSLFYMVKDFSHEQVKDKYGEPDDVLEMEGYFEYTYENVKFMNIKGELVFRFDEGGSSGSLIFVRWIIDGAEYSEKEMEKVATFFDNVYGKRTVRESGDYEWNNLIDDERVWFHKASYSGGYYDFEYRPW